MEGKVERAAIVAMSNLELCPAYNSAKGCDKDEDGCECLHLCKRYVLKKHHSKWQCGRSHGLYDEHNLRVLIKHGVDVSLDAGQVMKKIRQVFQNRRATAASEQRRVAGTKQVEVPMSANNDSDSKPTSQQSKVSGVKQVQVPASTSKGNDSNFTQQKQQRVLATKQVQVPTSANTTSDSKPTPQQSNVLGTKQVQVPASTSKGNDSNSTQQATRQVFTSAPKSNSSSLKLTMPTPKNLAPTGVQVSTSANRDGNSKSTQELSKVLETDRVQAPTSTSKSDDSKSVLQQHIQQRKVIAPTQVQTPMSANMDGDSKPTPQQSKVLGAKQVQISASTSNSNEYYSIHPQHSVSATKQVQVPMSANNDSDSKPTPQQPKVLGTKQVQVPASTSKGNDSKSAQQQRLHLTSTQVQAPASGNIVGDSKPAPKPPKVLTPTRAQVSTSAPDTSTSNSTSPSPKVLLSTGTLVSSSASIGGYSKPTTQQSSVSLLAACKGDDSQKLKILTPSQQQALMSANTAGDSKSTSQASEVLGTKQVQVPASTSKGNDSNSTQQHQRVLATKQVHVPTSANTTSDSKPTPQQSNVLGTKQVRVPTSTSKGNDSKSASQQRLHLTSTLVQTPASGNIVGDSKPASQPPKVLTPTRAQVSTSAPDTSTLNSTSPSFGMSETSKNKAVPGLEHNAQSTDRSDENSSPGKRAENNSSCLNWLNPRRWWEPAAREEIALEIQPEICVDHLEGICRDSAVCQHNRHTYQWQMNDKKTRRWLDLTDNENKAVEEAYCDPAANYVDVKNLSLRIDFTKMPYGRVDRSCDFRRLSTPSSCDTHCQSDYATEWIWYWLDENNKWISYDSVLDEGSQTSPSSRDIESQYLKTPGGSLTFKLHGNKYRIDFRDITQQNLSSEQRTECKVQRRPRGKCSSFEKEAQPEVCTDHLDGVCRNGNTCPSHHSRSPYQWQQYDKNTERWQDFTMEENSRVEDSFRNPAVDDFDVSKSLKIDFIQMLQGRIDVASGIRRLSTPSSRDKRGKSDHATEWIWYWLDENNQWVSYDSGLDEGSQTSPSSRDIETQYLKTPGGSLTFKLQGQTYRIDFKKFVQTNLVSMHGTERKVQRRPKGKCSSLEKEAQPDVCTDHLDGVCRNGNTCPRHHSRSPYQWQQYDKGTRRWQDFTVEENNRIEESFSDPAADNFDVSKSLRIDFTKMLQGKIDRASGIRRLSAPSSCDERSNKNYATEWVWYWLDPQNQWISYGTVFGGGRQASVTSKDIESQYRKTPDGSLLFKTWEYKYKIDFKTFTQKNLDPNYGTERKLRRRPKRKSSDDLIPKETPAPSHWDPRKIPETGYQLVDISKESTEYKKIEVTFGRTMKEYKIKKIQRIQNLELWDGFQRQKIWMQKKVVEGQTLDIRELFHGTKDEHVDAICLQGFDPRVSGTSSGTVYGQGSYFARDADYSRNYSSGNKMFMARVLVGEYSRGNTNYKRPPSRKSSSKDLYDSCVDNVSSPTIFVMFKQEQAYPEWLIEYTSSSWWPWN